MPHHCAAYGCNNNSGKPSSLTKNISFHRFPLKNNNMLKLWLLTIKRKNFVPNKHSVLCSDHFSEKYFEYTSKTRTRRLKRNAVPDKFVYKMKKSQRKEFLDVNITDESENSNSVPEVDDRISNNVADPIVCYVKRGTCDKNVQTDVDVNGLLAEIEELKKENADLKKILHFSKSCTRVIINQNYIQKDPNDERSASSVSGRIICYMKRVLEEKSVQTEHVIDEHQEDIEILQEENNDSGQMFLRKSSVKVEAIQY